MTTNAWGYRVSLLTYLGFLALDTLRPGFVSSAFSVHVLLIPVVVFAWGWSRESSHSSVVLDRVSAVAFGLAAGYMVWVKGEAFGDMRLFLAIGVFLFPLLAFPAKRETSSS